MTNRFSSELGSPNLPNRLPENLAGIKFGGLASEAEN